MGAKDLFKSLFYPKKKPTQKKVSPKKTHLKIAPKKDPTKSSALRDKQEIERLQERIKSSLQKDGNAKKAALIIEKMLHKK